MCPSSEPSNLDANPAASIQSTAVDSFYLGCPCRCGVWSRISSREFVGARVTRCPSCEDFSAACWSDLPAGLEGFGVLADFLPLDILHSLEVVFLWMLSLSV